MSIAIFCCSCGSSGTVAKVTAGLQCRCGSTDLGLDGVDPKPSHVLATAARLGREVRVSESDVNWSPPDTVTALQHNAGVVLPGNTGWNKVHPSATDGWAAYTGPPVTANPNPVHDVPRWPCPECQGSGYDTIDKGPCKACKGTGHYRPTTSAPDVMSYDPHPSPPSGGAARWHAAARTVTPLPGPERHSAASPLPPPTATPAKAASTGSATWPPPPGTPVLSLAPTRPTSDAPPPHLAAHRTAHGWWCCARCGSLADLDRRPELDPFLPTDPRLPEGFTRDGSMRIKASRLRKAPQDGRLLALIATVQAQNAVSHHEALTLARAALLKHVL